MGEIVRMEGDPEMVPLKSAAARTGLSYDCLRKMCLKGEVACFRTGKKWLINFGALCELLNGEKGGADNGTCI